LKKIAGDSWYSLSLKIRAQQIKKIEFELYCRISK